MRCHDVLDDFASLLLADIRHIESCRQLPVEAVDCNGDNDRCLIERMLHMNSGGLRRCNSA